MNLQAEKLNLIELLINTDDENLLREIKSKLSKKKRTSLKSMTLETFYAKIEGSEKAIRKGEVISQKALRKEVETWRRKSFLFQSAGNPSIVHPYAPSRPAASESRKSDKECNPCRMI